jgi:hypothetical protein
MKTIHVNIQGRTLLYVANKKRCKISTEEEDLELGH